MKILLKRFQFYLHDDVTKTGVYKSKFRTVMVI